MKSLTPTLSSPPVRARTNLAVRPAEENDITAWRESFVQSLAEAAGAPRA